MRRFLFFIFIVCSMVPISYWADIIPTRELAKDLSWLLTSRANIEILQNTGSTYTAFSHRYLNDLEGFTRKYITPFHILALRPTVDRSLAYHLRIQQYRVSCEIAALQIILNKLGIQASENDIISSLPQYPYIYASGGIWWDPDNEFVGFYTGSQSRQTGYGIYEKPLAQYTKIFKLKTEIINQYTYTGTMNPGIHMSTLLGHLNEKNTHVLLWWDWCTDPEYEDGVFQKWWQWIAEFFPLPGRNSCKNIAMNRSLKWKTPGWKEITWLSGEHAFVLLGYVGPLQNPSHIIVWDTYTGRHIYPYSEWMRKWSLMWFRSLSITRPR